MSDNSAPTTPPEKQTPWYSEMNKYHWIVFIICSLGWAFDCMDQHLFTAVRTAAIADQMGISDSTSPEVMWYATLATSLMMIGWATGGIIFGIVGDKFGRAKTMFWTILIYSLLTGLSALTNHLWDFLLLRFLAGVGIGGQFGIGASLLAESVPGKARPYLLGFMQVLSAVGNIGAALVVMSFAYLQSLEVLPLAQWRCVFLFGTVPVVLVYFVRRYLKEPESWTRTVKEKHETAGSIKELFTDPICRKHVILGMILASAGIIGTWGIGLFGMELTGMVYKKIAAEKDEYRQIIDPVLTKYKWEKEKDLRAFLSDIDKAKTNEGIINQIQNAYEIKFEQEINLVQVVLDKRSAVSGEVVTGENVTEIQNAAAQVKKKTDDTVAWWRGVYLLIYNFGAMAGMFGFTMGAVYWGRRVTFTIFMLGCIIFTSATFLFLNSVLTLFILVPLMSFFLMSMFGGYTIYFPELFPTRLRSTGISFCYNVARYVAAFGPMMLGGIMWLFSGFNTPDDGSISLRYAGATMTSIFIIGIIAIWLMPETKGKPLPD
ncbi:MAG: MFS transporter [Planctomycetaceae bacterium]|nr:MFS transporter [Planctomycetaceae bacterium]